MAIIFDKELAYKPIFEVLGCNYYWCNTFKYPRIFRYHITENSIIKDLDRIPLKDIDSTERAIIIFKYHHHSKFVTKPMLEWILTHIQARLILQKEIVWSVIEANNISKRKLEITLSVPMIKNSIVFMYFKI